MTINCDSHSRAFIYANLSASTDKTMKNELNIFIDFFYDVDASEVKRQMQMVIRLPKQECMTYNLIMRYIHLSPCIHDNSLRYTTNS